MTVKTEGIGELQKAFAGLRDDMKLRTSLRMVASAASVLKKEAKTIAQSKGLVKTGAMIRNIAIKRERKAPAGVTQYHLGVRHGRQLGNGKKIIKFFELNKRGRVVIRRKNDPFYWRFQEFGTKYIQAHRFIQQSLENKRAEAIAAMEKRLQQDIEKANKSVNT